MLDFQRGLTGLVGPPANGDAQQVMYAEHSERPDSQEWFSVGNYGTTTTSEIEYAFIVDPTQGTLSKLGLEDEGWPRESRLEEAGREFASRMRVPTPLEAFEKQRADFHRRVRELTGGSFTREALIGGRLYTGPLFVKYNAVLRGKQRNAPPFAVGRLEGLCGAAPDTNLYVTTLHVINTALVSLGCCTKATMVYRGMSGGAMPECFREADEFGLKGGVELGCMSTTDDGHVAFEYAAGDFGLVMEIKQGDNSRGASFSWLSQYPHECDDAPAPSPLVYRACTARAPLLPIAFRTLAVTLSPARPLTLALLPWLLVRNYTVPPPIAGPRSPSPPSRSWR